MINLTSQFAESSTPSGIGALGLNLKAFIFQLITFLIVLGILRKWVFPKLVATLEERRETLEKSLDQARETEEALHQAEEKATELLKQARVEADSALSDAEARAKEIIAAAEKSGEQSAERIITEAEAHLGQERAKLKNELKKELGDLVVLTTEKVLQQKLTEKDDMELIKQSVKELEG